MLISLIQFLHNGPEHLPDNETGKSWNRNSHKRKFLKCNGTYVGENDNKIDTDIVFWGEWEPESKIIKRIATPIEDGPHYVYEPYYILPNSYQGLQNTDPFVFGKEFRYSFCLQPSHPSLRNLEKGSLILFGSRVRKKFVLDTAFVVSHYVEYDRQNYEALLRQIDQTYENVTVNAIVKGKGSGCGKTDNRKVDPVTYRSYCGAVFDNRVDGMFSFFPCQPYDPDSSGFARPIIEMPKITDRMIRGIKITKCKDLDDVSNYWKEVVSQVTRTCSLGIFAEMPPKYETS